MSFPTPCYNNGYASLQLISNIILIFRIFIENLPKDSIPKKLLDKGKLSESEEVSLTN